MNEGAPDREIQTTPGKIESQVESQVEERPAWNLDPGCEAEVRERTLQQGYLDGMWTEAGKQIRDPKRQQSPTVIETTINCPGCGIVDKFRSEGMGFSATNASSRRVGSFLQNNCAKLLTKGYPPGQIPRKLLPK
ncbi:MAG: hypothetical protein Q7S88_02390 [Candidatus Daviesbacteria bacterium]|nr:hypothetical protein [Candidatus Daviesbacteria bacterium]